MWILGLYIGEPIENEYNPLALMKEQNTYVSSSQKSGKGQDCFASGWFEIANLLSAIFVKLFRAHKHNINECRIYVFTQCCMQLKNRHKMKTELSRLETVCETLDVDFCSMHKENSRSNIYLLLKIVQKCTTVQ